MYDYDKQFMNLAMDLAKRGEGYTSPNPLVGAVIVKNNRIIGQGYHEKYGELHAERNALAACTENPEGATIYVTLEPCCHYGKTPPCTEAIIEHKLARVVIGSRDPNPLVSGKGARILEEHGIEVVRDFMRAECDSLNPIFFHYITNQTPFVVMKYAMTLDGKIATYTGASKWITGEVARKNVHKDRHKYRGIMVGIETVIRDNPMLTCRLEKGRNPVRIICDTKLRIPLDLNVLETSEAETIIATACTDKEKQRPLIEKGCKIVEVPLSGESIDLKELMITLGKEKIDSILLEGGGTLNWSALNSRIVNKVQSYISPKIFGGQTSKTPVSGIGVCLPDEAFTLKNTKISHYGDDILIEGEVI